MSEKNPSNTSPGFDGFTYEFFKFFWNDIGQFLLRAINASYVKGELSESLRRGVITCLPKGNKDKQFLKNWRPISLLNTSYKLASSCIAERLKSVLPKLINEDQTGFISGRYIGDNIRLLYDIINYTEKQNIPGMLVLIDFEKAFDSVSWDFLFKVLDYFKFGESFQKWVKMFYLKIQSCVAVNGHLSEWFNLERGCRQGDPLSPYLFILCAEILAVLIRNNNDIKGININNTVFVISQYADDTSFLLDGSEKSLENCLKILKLYASASGLCINLEKTKVVWIGSEKASKRRFCENYNLSWESEEFSVLGITFPKNLANIVEINYSKKIEEMGKLFQSWSKRILTPLGKITVIKSLALPKINHLISALPTPPNKVIKEIQSLFYKYLWNNGPDKIKREVIEQNYENGGLKMVNVDKFMRSMKLTWMRRILTKSNKYLETVANMFPDITTCFRYGGAYINERRLNTINNRFWRDVLYCYKSIIEIVKPTNNTEILSTPLWFNTNIKVGGATVYYREWERKGVSFINDILDQNCQPLAFETFCRKFSLQTNFLQYEGFIRSVRTFISNNATEIESLINGPIRSIYCSLIVIDKKGCRRMYNACVANNAKPSCLSKWQKELDIDMDLVWKGLFNMPFRLSNDTAIRWFQTRINHRILGTNHYLFKMKIKSNDKCTF
ncbi:MAG: reverse transcriptase family protein [Candidatus Thiodiazotropha endolucinida]|nr:reverse transcriptase family protein [Candidatus Thiodiazotropha taylori]MCW4264989.1 reverse transcriptase family protein [Candidatus Thiodiazotropha endolucinida]